MAHTALGESEVQCSLDLPAELACFPSYLPAVRLSSRIVFVQGFGKFRTYRLRLLIATMFTFQRYSPICTHEYSQTPTLLFDECDGREPGRPLITRWREGSMALGGVQ